MKDADKLYEKFTHEVSRKTQSDAWSEVAKQLKEKEKIEFGNVAKLEQNVTNWVRRSTVSALITFSLK